MAQFLLSRAGANGVFTLALICGVVQLWITRPGIIMRKSYQILAAVAVVLVLVLVLAALFSTGSGGGGPRLTVNYLNQTNYAGYATACFAVTNIGDASAVIPGDKAALSWPGSPAGI